MHGLMFQKCVKLSVKIGEVQNGVIYWWRGPGKRAYVLQERGIAKEEIWDDFEVWFREELQEKSRQRKMPGQFLPGVRRLQSYAMR